MVWLSVCWDIGESPANEPIKMPLGCRLVWVRGTMHQMGCDRAGRGIVKADMPGFFSHIINRRVAAAAMPVFPARQSRRT